MISKVSGQMNSWGTGTRVPSAAVMVFSESWFDSTVMLFLYCLMYDCFLLLLACVEAWWIFMTANAVNLLLFFVLFRSRTITAKKVRGRYLHHTSATSGSYCYIRSVDRSEKHKQDCVYTWQSSGDSLLENVLDIIINRLSQEPHEALQWRDIGFIRIQEHHINFNVVDTDWVTSPDDGLLPGESFLRITVKFSRPVQSVHYFISLHLFGN